MQFFRLNLYIIVTTISHGSHLLLSSRLLVQPASAPRNYITKPKSVRQAENLGCKIEQPYDAFVGYKNFSRSSAWTVFFVHQNVN
jgi:hypothetical protein